MELLERVECQERIQAIASQTRVHLNTLNDNENISNIRNLGTIGAFDVGSAGGYFSGSFSKDFSKLCQQKGALIRPLGETVYTVPPYCTTDMQLDRIYGSIRDSLDDMGAV